MADLQAVLKKIAPSLPGAARQLPLTVTEPQGLSALPGGNRVEGRPASMRNSRIVFKGQRNTLVIEDGVKMENFAALCFYAPATEHINNRTDIDPFLAKVDGNGVAGDSADGPMRVYVGCDLAEDADASLFAAAVEVAIGTGDLDLSSRRVFTDDSRSGRIDFWASLGGFFFIGLFLGSLFLMAAVLIVYYKQVSEGYEDARSFVIMQQVGMTQREVKSSIKSQISLVFFLPLLAAACHTAGAFPMTKLILTLFGLSNTGLFGLCSLVTILIFAVVYYLIYRLTAREYYRIVRR